jgi:ribosomal protein L44E
MHRADELILHLFRLSREMIILADQGHAAAPDDGCRLLFGVLQDCAYKIRQAAERERDAHRRLTGSGAAEERNPQAGRTHHLRKEELFMGCTACGKKEGLTSEQQALLAALAKTAAPAASRELAAMSGLDGKIVSCGLKSLKERGYIDSPARCRYSITAAGRAALG